MKRRKERPSGWYWIKTYKGMRWEPAEWDGVQWNILDNYAERMITVINIPNFYNIGPRIRKPRMK